MSEVEGEGEQSDEAAEISPHLRTPVHGKGVNHR